jgi:hypothetical protein
VVESGEAHPFWVSFEPLRGGEFEDALVVRAGSHSAETPPVDESIQIPLLGSAQYPEQVDTFEIPGLPKVDLLLVIDTATAAAPFRESTLRNLIDFAVYLESRAFDLQVAMILASASEGGRLEGPENEVLLRGGSDERFVDELADRFRSLPPDLGPNEPLEAARLALTDTLRSGPHEGWVRDGSPLSVISVSPREDRSPGAVADYLGTFAEVKGSHNAQLFSFNVIGGTTEGCVRGELRGESNPRLREVAEATGGVFASICAPDWSRTLEGLSRTTGGFKRFFLNNQPVVATIRVFVDGVEVEPVTDAQRIQWTYDFATNSVNFAPLSYPEPGAHVRVSYRRQCP